MSKHLSEVPHAHAFDWIRILTFDHLKYFLCFLNIRMLSQEKFMKCVIRKTVAMHINLTMY